jgi:hypothetical protein
MMGGNEMGQVFHEEPLGDEVRVKLGMEIKVNKILSVFFLNFALGILKRCKRSKEQEPILDILQIHILAAVSLEAFINEVISDQIDKKQDFGEETKKLEDLMFRNEGRGAPIREKWEKLPEYLWNKQFKKNSTLWEHFDALIELRNALVHYKAEYLDQGAVPRKLEKALKIVLVKAMPHKMKQSKRGSIIDKLFEDRAHWINRVCTLDMGDWACETAHQMIEKILEFDSVDNDIGPDYVTVMERLGIRKASP